MLCTSCRLTVLIFLEFCGKRPHRRRTKYREHTCLGWIQEGFKGGGTFLGDSIWIPGVRPIATLIFSLQLRLLACNAEFWWPKIRIISLKVCRQIISQMFCIKGLLNPANACQKFRSSKGLEFYLFLSGSQVHPAVSGRESH